MYAIAHVIYGVDLTYFPFRDLGLSEDTLQAIEDREIGLIESKYSGNGDAPVWFGVKLTSFDECGSFLLSQIVEESKITPEVEKKWNNLLEELKNDEPEIKAAFDKYAKENPDFSFEPRVWVLWGSS